MAHEQSAGITSNKKSVKKTTVQPGYTRTTTTTVNRDGSGSLSTKTQPWGGGNVITPKTSDDFYTMNDISTEQAYTPTPAPKRGLNDFTIGLSKSDRYRQMASNLATLATSRTNSANGKDKGFMIGAGVNSTLASIIGLAVGGVAGMGIASGLATGLNSLVNGLFNDSDKDREKAALYEQMAGNITGYLTNLTNRDTTIMNTMDQIYSSMDSLRGTYGSEFVDMMYNYYLAQSGMTSDAYSLLTGNFQTFEEIGSGNVSAENGVFDTLTDGNQNFFNNVYAQLQIGDLTSNKPLLDRMVQSFYGADTELAIQLRGYENELRTALKGASAQQDQMMLQSRYELESLGATIRGENISYQQSIGGAEAEAASSGVRGGTSGNNVALARLTRDLGQIQRTANYASMIGTLKYNIQNAQLNASSTAYSYRMAQKRAITGALNSSIASFNAIGRASQSGERQSNYYLAESKSYQRQFTEQFEGMSEKDKDAIFKVTGR